MHGTEQYSWVNPYTGSEWQELLKMPDAESSTDTPVFKLPLPPDENLVPPSIPPRIHRSERSTKSLTLFSSEPASNRVSGASSVVDVRAAGDGSLDPLTAPSSSSLPARPHRFIRVSVSYPKLCSLCNDYVITPRCSAYHCTCCKSVFHAKCSRVATAHATRAPCVRPDSSISPKVSNSSSTPARPCLMKDDHLATGMVVSSSEQPLTNWNEGQVAYWLSVVGLSRFVVLFLRNKIDGKTLVNLAPYSAHLDQVTDPFARQALRRAILVLSGCQPSAGDDITAPSDDVNEIFLESSKNETSHIGGDASHQLRVTSFLQEVACASCTLPLLGLYRQGLQCHLCGMIFHRTCASLDDLPDCPNSFPPPDSSEDSLDRPGLETLEYKHLPRRFLVHSSLYFGVALEEQPLDPNSSVPLFLLTCTNEIERIASNSFLLCDEQPLDPVNLVDAYQQTALTATLIELHKQHSNSLPSAGSSKSDVVRLTQLVKAFLRALPVPVIPEDYYQDFCALSTVTNTAERKEAVHFFLAKLPHPHQVCLSHVMKHLDFVWAHQRKLQDYLTTEPQDSKSVTLSGMRIQHLCKPTSWLLVFRQILIRPPWPLLTDFAVGLEKHLRSLQAIFLTLATTPSDTSPLGPAILHLPLPVKEVKKVFPVATKTTPRQSTAVDKLEYGAMEFSPLDHLVAPETPTPTVDTPPSPMSRDKNAQDLATQEWYWGDLSQAAVREIMAGLPDGYFLVRDASATSVGAFTLAVRLHGENKLLRIYHRGDYFGVVDPPPPIFRLVSELIDYYRSHSIRTEEDLRLQPISHRHYRFSGLTANSTTSESAPTSSLGDRGVYACHLPREQLLLQLSRTNSELSQCESHIKELSGIAQQAMRSKNEAALSMKGYQQLHDWFQLQQKRLDQHSNLQTLGRFHDILRMKLVEAERQIEASNQQFALDSNRCRDILEEQVKSTARRRKLKRQAQEVHRALKQQGVPDEVILNRCNTDEGGGDSRYSGTQSTRSTSVGTLISREQDYENIGLTIPSEIINSAAWFMPNVTREKAEEMLANKPSGTFLIRSSGDGKSLVLSVRVDSSVQHCLIYCDDGRYGFVRLSSQSFATLEALVCHYHVYSLQQHNRLMRTTLRYPVNSHL